MGGQVSLERGEAERQEGNVGLGVKTDDATLLPDPIIPGLTRDLYT